MTDRYGSANTATTDVPADYVDYRDKEVMQALVTVGALVALADGHLENVERDELVNFVHRQDFAPTISKRGITKAFDSRVRQLKENYSPNQIMEALHPLAGLSLASVVVRTAERVAVADRKIHPGELQALKLIRLIMTAFPLKKGMLGIPSVLHRLKFEESRLPRYYFTIRSSDHEDIDPRGSQFADDDAALDYACCMIRRLQASGGYDDPGLILEVRNERRETVFFIPFLPACA